MGAGDVGECDSIATVVCCDGITLVIWQWGNRALVAHVMDCAPFLQLPLSCSSLENSVVLSCFKVRTHRQRWRHTGW